ncbi:hypothetical protein BZA77DRAFT_324053 [Pyronema omphalodes]|nr:hypothetical protein BZA77DRAFT_324053 [Pyronema omphalodes]
MDVSVRRCLDGNSVLESELELGLLVNDVGRVNSTIANVVNLNVRTKALAAVSASSALRGLLRVGNEDGILLNHLVSDNASIDTATGGSKAVDNSGISGDAASISKDDGSGGGVHDTGSGNTSVGIKDFNTDGLEAGDSVGINEVNGDGSIGSGTGIGGSSGGGSASCGVGDGAGGGVTVVDGNVDGNGVSRGGVSSGGWVIDNDDNGVSRSRISYNGAIGNSFTGGDVDGNVLGRNGVGKSNGSEGADGEENTGDHFEGRYNFPSESLRMMKDVSEMSVMMRRY